ncbi:JM79 [macacine gammaherpesvirus 11]|uniref:JM79 n=2 Tax=macacine gammaherpesvirus 11 TaxID=2560570 RepID=G9JM87_9GAMA|nr:JM79 [Macaca fuscata rhadinovirus]AAT00056.1 JM79 [Macaca fuscata rhadinovirus]AEW87604.1 JM79 [Macaca fuscata rhadinovirus]AEW87774.1 JM79 [Macaca fuscata rhadinovirus]
MAVSIPVQGVDRETESNWRSIVTTFEQHGNADRAIRSLLRFFKGVDHPGFLASLVILKDVAIDSEKTIERTDIIPLLQGVRFVTQQIYMHLKDHASESPVTEIWRDCKERFCLALELACGCQSCTSAARQLRDCQQACRPPKLNPHKQQCGAARLLTAVYNQMVLRTRVSVSEFCLNALMCVPREFGFVSGDVRVETSRVASCMNLSWLYLILDSYIRTDLTNLEMAMSRACRIRGLSTRDPFYSALVWLKNSCACAANTFFFTVNSTRVTTPILMDICASLAGPVPDVIKINMLPLVNNQMYPSVCVERANFTGSCPKMSPTHRFDGLKLETTSLTLAADSLDDILQALELICDDDEGILDSHISDIDTETEVDESTIEEEIVFEELS